jgi:hypothetical protein
MTVGIGGRQFASCTGRAVSIRHRDAGTDPGNVLREASRAGATILIASPGFLSSPEPAIAVAAGHGFEVVISACISDAIRNSLVNATIFPVSLAPETIAKIQETVESDPGMALTVDVGRGEVRARGELLARFDIHRQAGPRPQEPAGQTDIESDSGDRGGEAIAGRLLMAQRLLGSASLSAEVRMRLQRRLVAICDAMKAPGADSLRCARRLDLLLTELARTGQPGPARAPGSRAPTPGGALQAQDTGQRGGSTRARRGP